MDIFLAIVLFGVGAVIVAKGADFFVSASTWVSDVTGISKVLIGATVVAIATSGPELFVSLFASLQGQTDMSTGNVVGSHLCNLGLGFALIAMFRPAKNSDKLYLPNAVITLLTAVLLLIFFFIGEMTIIHALILVAVYAVFTYINIKHNDSGLELAPSTATGDGEEAQQNPQVLEDAAATSATLQDRYNAQPKQKPKRAKKPTNRKEIIINVVKFVVGITGIILGSRLIVDNATVLAKAMGVSEMVIGLTIVAIGTSLPEIVTTIVALIKKENDLGIGNVFGSCIFNNALIIPISTFVVGALQFNDSLLVDLPIAILLTAIAIIPTAIGKRIYRLQGVAIAALYLGYIGYLVVVS